MKIQCDFATKLGIQGYKMTLEAIVASHERTGLTGSVVRIVGNYSVRVETTRDGFKITKV
jgi:hypothetical protein